MAEFDPDAYLAKEDKKKGFDPDAYLAKSKPESALQTFGRSTASMADSALNAITGTLDYGAYALARAAGRSPEQAQAETTSPKDVVGRAFGVTGTPGYEQAPLRQLGNYTGEVLGENVIQPLAQATGLPEQDVGNMLNTGMMAAGAVAPKAIAPVKTFAKNVNDVATGFGGTFGSRPGIAKPGVEPQVWQKPSALEPAGPNYLPPEQRAAWDAGKLSTAEAQQAMTNWTPEQVKALERTKGLVPYAGKKWQGVGEMLAQPYHSLSGYLPDAGLALAGAMTPLGPLGAAALPAAKMLYNTYKAVNAGKTLGAASQLEGVGFTPMSAAERQALSTGAPHPSVAGAVSPGGMAQATPAASAAMATTQAVSQQKAPRPQPQPKQTWTMPDVGSHYAAAEQNSANFGDTFNKAVSTRTQDLLKDAKLRGQPLTPEQAGDLAYDQVKQWRSENVEAFKPKQQSTPEPTVTTEEAVAEFNPPKVDPELASDQRIWKMLQEKTAEGKELLPNEQTAVKRITNKYGQDPFQTGNLTGESILETPKTEPKKRDMSVGNAKKQFYKDIENDATDIDAAMKKYEIVTTKKQMRVYDAAYDAAIAEGKDVESARRAGKQALQRNGLPPLFGDQTTARMKPKDTNKQETAMGQAWFDDTIKNADKQTKKMYQDMLENTYNGDVGQFYRDVSAQKSGKSTGKSFFEEPLDTTTPKGKPPAGVMEMKTDKPNDVMGNIMMGKLKQNYDDFPTGSYTENGIRHEIIDNAAYTNMPEDVRKLVPDLPKKIYRQVDVKTGKVLQGPKSYSDLQAEAADLLKQAKEGKKKQGK
jgi:hypothetical protein